MFPLHYIVPFFALFQHKVLINLLILFVNKMGRQCW